MAAPMDIPDSDGGKGKNGSALAVNKSSTKINKNLRRAITQPRPAPQVYKTEPGEFRTLVQQLTGTSPPVEPTILTPKPSNSRLQKIAPPPLRPVFSYVSMHPPQPSQAQFNPGPLRMNGNLNSLVQYPAQRPSSFAVSPLSSSPLPALSPNDQIWANSLQQLESPGSVAMRQLAHSIAGGDVGENVVSHQENGLLTSLHSRGSSQFYLPPRFNAALSPRFSPPFNLPSPGMSPNFGLGNFGYGFSGQFSPTAALATDTSFSFPEPDITSSTFS